MKCGHLGKENPLQFHISNNLLVKNAVMGMTRTHTHTYKVNVSLTGHVTFQSAVVLVWFDVTMWAGWWRNQFQYALWQSWNSWRRHWRWWFLRLAILLQEHVVQYLLIQVNKCIPKLRRGQTETWSNQICVYTCILNCPHWSCEMQWVSDGTFKGFWSGSNLLREPDLSSWIKKPSLISAFFLRCKEPINCSSKLTCS